MINPLPHHIADDSQASASEAALEHYSQLLLKVALKDRGAFIEIFHHFAPRIKSYLLKNGLPEAAAEDVTQATMIAVWNNAASFQPTRANASTWIFTIARNKRIDYFRQAKRPEISLDDLEVHNVNALSEENIQSHLEKTETAHILLKELNLLPSEQAELLKMAFFQDKSHADISREKKIPLGTVKSRIRLALTKLKTALKQTRGVF